MVSIAKNASGDYTEAIMHFDRIENGSRSIQLRDGQLHIKRETLTRFVQTGFDRLSFTFTKEHLEHLITIVLTDTNSHNDRMVASFLLKNAVISSKGVYALCQDTGIANIFAWKDTTIHTDGDDITDISAGAESTYRNRNLRFSTTIPESLFSEHDPGTNMPAQISITATAENPAQGPAYRFILCAKGGGSSNKTTLVQATKSILNRESFEAWLKKQIPALGTAACPPYSIAVVVGGLSPEQNLLALKLATTGFFDEKLEGWDYRVLGCEPIRDKEWEETALRIACESGLGAQFGGKALAISARVLRLPRHGASCPVSIGVSCSAHRNLHGVINKDGMWLEHTEKDPLSVEGLAEAIAWGEQKTGKKIEINLDEGIQAVRTKLSGLEPGTPVVLSGNILVARDAAHARWKELVDSGAPLPDYTTAYPILYAGPAQTPPGCVTGSFGPTTAGRMDDYAELLMKRGAALVTVAKGNRSEAWRTACEKYGSTYLGTVGGAAALIAEECITASRILDYEDLGMEAVRLVTLRELPAFILVNDKGLDFYKIIQEKTL